MREADKPRAAIMARVSSDRQEMGRQVADLQAEADRRGWRVVVVLNETVSASRRKESGNQALIAEERQMLRNCLKLASEGRLDKVMAHGWGSPGSSCPSVVCVGSSCVIKSQSLLGLPSTFPR